MFQLLLFVLALAAAKPIYESNHFQNYPGYVFAHPTMYNSFQRPLPGPFYRASVFQNPFYSSFRPPQFVQSSSPILGIRTHPQFHHVPHPVFRVGHFADAVPKPVVHTHHVPKIDDPPHITEVKSFGLAYVEPVVTPAHHNVVPELAPVEESIPAITTYHAPESEAAYPKSNHVSIPGFHFLRAHYDHNELSKPNQAYYSVYASDEDDNSVEVFFHRKSQAVHRSEVGTQPEANPMPYTGYFSDEDHYDSPEVFYHTDPKVTHRSAAETPLDVSPIYYTVHDSREDDHDDSHEVFFHRKSQAVHRSAVGTPPLTNPMPYTGYFSDEDHYDSPEVYYHTEPKATHRSAAETPFEVNPIHYTVVHDSREDDHDDSHEVIFHSKSQAVHRSAVGIPLPPLGNRLVPLPYPVHVSDEDHYDSPEVFYHSK